jgi:hypothetical protein
MSLTLISATGDPPVVTISAAVKLVPTDSLNVKVNVTGPLAVAPAMLSSMTKVGATVSAAEASSPPPPPHAAMKRDAASAQADRANLLDG